MKNSNLTRLILSALVLGQCVSCSTLTNTVVGSNCSVTPPDRSWVPFIDIKDTKYLLEEFAAVDHSLGEYIQMTKRVFNAIDDADVACHMLLNLTDCLSETNKGSQSVITFLENLELRKCQRVYQPQLSFENVSQLPVDDAARWLVIPLKFELILRNSGDLTAHVSAINLNVASDNLSSVSKPVAIGTEVYVMAIDSQGIVVLGTEGPWSIEDKSFGGIKVATTHNGNIINIEIPIKLPIEPRSLRLLEVWTYNLPAPTGKMEVKVKYDFDLEINSSSLTLVEQQPCIRFAVPVDGKMVDRWFCP